MVTDAGSAAQERDAGGVIGGLARVIAWTLGPDLTTCTFQAVTTHRGAPGK